MKLQRAAPGTRRVEIGIVAGETNEDVMQKVK
jgi:hypothetical protein